MHINHFVKNQMDGFCFIADSDSNCYLSGNVENFYINFNNLCNSFKLKNNLLKQSLLFLWQLPNYKSVHEINSFKTNLGKNGVCRAHRPYNIYFVQMV